MGLAVSEEEMAANERTCVGCAKRAPHELLVRLVLAETPDGKASVVPDAKGGSFGRGAHVHANAACLELATKRGLSRAYKREVRADADELAAAIATAYERRVAGLLSGSARAGHVVIGTDAVVEALRTGRVALTLIAGDAAAAAERTEVRRLIAEGRSLPYLDRVRLAESLGRHGERVREGVAVIAIVDEALAIQVRRAVVVASSMRSFPAKDVKGAREVAGRVGRTDTSRESAG